MTTKEFFEYLTKDAGLDDATARVVMGLADNDKMSSKVAGFVQKAEYESLANRAAAIEASYNKAKVVEDWWRENGSAVHALKARHDRYVERFGSLDDPATNRAVAAATPSPEDLKKMVHETANDLIQQNYAPRWSDLLVKSSGLVQRHIRAGRKSDIDFKKVEELSAKYGGDIERAYEEWDKPEADAAAKAAEESRIEARVKEELARRASTSFPAGADAAPSPGSAGLSRSEKPKYDRAAMIRTAATGEYGAN